MKRKQPNAEDAKDSQRAQKMQIKKMGFFCALCEPFASSASGLFVV